MNVQDKHSAKKSGKSSKKSVLGVVTDTGEANRIVKEFQQAGFRNGDISAIFPDKQASREFAHEKNTKAPEGAVTGAGLGGVVGGTLGLLAGLGMLAIPGIGPLIAAGPIMAALSGIAAGAAVGGLSGALIGLGVPEYNAKLYEARVKAGNILLAVHVDDGDWAEKAKSIFEANDATDVATVNEASGEGRTGSKNVNQGRAGSNGGNGHTSGTRRGFASQIREEMPVVCSQGNQFAVVDHMEGASSVKLNRDAMGVHHYIPLAWVTSVDDKVHIDRTGERATREWTTAPASR